MSFFSLYFILLLFFSHCKYFLKVYTNLLTNYYGALRCLTITVAVICLL